MQPSDPAPETGGDPAAMRFWILQAMRIGGLLLVIGGLLIISGQVPGPQPLGLGLLVLGAIEFFALPVLLARRWKTPDA